MENNLNKLSKLVLVYLPGTILPTLIGLLSTAVFTRIFESKDYGKYCYVISITMFVITLASQWIQQAINRFIPQSCSIEELNKYNKIISLGICLISICLITCFIATKPIFSSFAPEWNSFYPPTAFFIIVSIVYNILVSTLQARLMAKQYATINFINALFKFILSYTMVMLLFKCPENLLWGAGISIFLLIPVLWKKSEAASPLSVLKDGQIIDLLSNLKEFMIYGLPMTGWFLASVILNISDRYLIQWFRGSSEVGIYAANYSLVTGAAAVLAMPITLAVHPFLMKSWVSGEKGETERLLSIIIEVYLTLGVATIVLINLFSQDIVNIFLGAEFRKGHIILPIVIGGIVVWQLSTYTHKPLEFAGRTIVMMWACIFCAVVNIILNIIFIPKFGYVIAAYTTVISYILYNIIVTLIGRKILRWNIVYTRFIKNVLALIIIYYATNMLRLKLHKSFAYAAEVLISVVVSCLMIGCILVWNKKMLNNVSTDIISKDIK